ncbi:MAG TPA: OmpA family protein [Rhodanobacteraceae bacterium]|nr:OmpA family protein [Rhodanobacteraceae bacterium]
MPGKLIATALLAAFATTAMAAKVDLDYQRLNHSLNQLASDPVLGRYAEAERSLARQAVQDLQDVSSKRRPYVLYIAERRVDLAKAAAQLAEARHKLTQLRSEHSQILLTASRRDAAATRRELERERLQNQLAAEQAERLQAQGEAYSQAAEEARAAAAQANKLAASQAHAAALARHEAQLAESAVKLMRQQLDHLQARQGAEGLQMTLGGVAFATGQTTLRPEARAHLGKLVKFVQSQPDKHIRIEGYTDSSGNAAVNQSLSLKRAQSVRQALVEQGVSASRITAVGMGETHPVASNDTATGRAKNRRVVVILKDQ